MFEIFVLIALVLGAGAAALYAVWPLLKEYDRLHNEYLVRHAAYEVTMKKYQDEKDARKARHEAWLNRPRRPIREDA
jgi:hypothetical protein